MRCLLDAAFFLIQFLTYNINTMDNEGTVIKIKLSESKLLEVLKTGALTFYDYQVLSNEPEGVDYSEDELWQEAKKASTKAYKALKKREFDIRHNNDKKLINIIK